MLNITSQLSRFATAIGNLIGLPKPPPPIELYWYLKLNSGPKQTLSSLMKTTVNNSGYTEAKESVRNLAITKIEIVVDSHSSQDLFTVIPQWTIQWRVKIKGRSNDVFMGPFRTSIPAKTYEEAVLKIKTKFLDNMDVVVMDKWELSKSPYKELQDAFDSFDSVFEDLEKTITNFSDAAYRISKKDPNYTKIHRHWRTNY